MIHLLSMLHALIIEPAKNPGKITAHHGIASMDDLIPWLSYT
jgi:hypothetical protein